MRREIRAARDAMPPRERAAASREILRVLRTMPEFQRANGVHCFLSLKAEVDTAPILAACASAGKKILVPYVEEAAARLGWSLWWPGQPVALASLGVAEPAPESRVAVPAGEIGLVLAPGLAFDRQGGRLGYGKGYYDEFLARLGSEGTSPPRIALAFALQIVPAVPMGAGDERMDWIVSESGAIKTNPPV